MSYTIRSIKKQADGLYSVAFEDPNWGTSHTGTRLYEITYDPAKGKGKLETDAKAILNANKDEKDAENLIVLDIKDVIEKLVIA